MVRRKSGKFAGKPAGGKYRPSQVDDDVRESFDAVMESDEVVGSCEGGGVWGGGRGPGWPASSSRGTLRRFGGPPGF